MDSFEARQTPAKVDPIFKLHARQYGRTYRFRDFEGQNRGVAMDSLSALGVFVRAAEARSFTDAGRRLSVSSSAIGKTISRLEDRLGVRLFHRNTRAITLTPEGELFLESCRRIFSEINKIELEFSQSKA